MSEKSRFWFEPLAYRERLEVLHAENYVESFNHGTSGHLSLTTMAKASAICEAMCNKLSEMGVTPEDIGAIAQHAVDAMLIAPSGNK